MVSAGRVKDYAQVWRLEPRKHELEEIPVIAELFYTDARICRGCLDGVGSECHSPGCLFWMADVPRPNNASLRSKMHCVAATVTPAEMHESRQRGVRDGLALAVREVQQLTWTAAEQLIEDAVAQSKHHPEGVELSISGILEAFAEARQDLPRHVVELTAKSRGRSKDDFKGMSPDEIIQGMTTLLDSMAADDGN